MACERLLVLKHSSIGNDRCLLYSDIHPHDCRGSCRTLFANFDLKRDIPVACFTGNSGSQDLDGFTEHLFALMTFLGIGRLPFLDKTEVFSEIDRSQFVQKFASILLRLALIKDETPQNWKRDPMTPYDEFVVGEIKRFVCFPLFL
jgi:hypothetical protein